jgi:hypothetical protein
MNGANLSLSLSHDTDPLEREKSNNKQAPSCLSLLLALKLFPLCTAVADACQICTSPDEFTRKSAHFLISKSEGNYFYGLVKVIARSQLKCTLVSVLHTNFSAVFREDSLEGDIVSEHYRSLHCSHAPYSEKHSLAERNSN